MGADSNLLVCCSTIHNPMLHDYWYIWFQLCHMMLAPFFPMPHPLAGMMGGGALADSDDTLPRFLEPADVLLQLEGSAKS